MQRTVRPAVDKSGKREPCPTTKQRWQIGISFFQMQGNGKGIPDDCTAIIDHRYGFLPAPLNRTDLGEQRRHGFHIEPLVGQRHAGAPTGRGKPQITVGCAKIIQLDGHVDFLKVRWWARIMPPPDCHGQKNFARREISRKTNAPCPHP